MSEAEDLSDQEIRYQAWEQGRQAPARPIGGDEPEVYFPSGPALLYVYSDQGNMIAEATHTIMRVDTGSLPAAGGPVSAADARRERRLLRALCEHVLHQLSQKGE